MLDMFLSFSRELRLEYWSLEYGEEDVITLRWEVVKMVPDSIRSLRLEMLLRLRVSASELHSA
jgi:hypothetical protein